MSRINVYVPLKGHIVAETAKAIRFEFQVDEESRRVEWFPISQCSQILRVPPEYPPSEEESIIMIAEWILKDKGILKHSLTEGEKQKLDGALEGKRLSSQENRNKRIVNDMDDDIPF